MIERRKSKKERKGNARENEQKGKAGRNKLKQRNTFLHPQKA